MPGYERTGLKGQLGKVKQSQVRQVKQIDIISSQGPPLTVKKQLQTKSQGMNIEVS
jgi:hypothetical protein